MTTVAAGWIKQNDDNETYTSISFDKAIMPFTITPDKRFVLKANKNKTGDNPNAPDYYLDCFIPDPTKSKKDE